MLLLYGANGYTGELVAAEALARGLSPVLAGRSGSALAALGARLGLPHRTFGLDDPAALRAGLEGVTAVLHCAGPFIHTSRPMVDACLAAGVHYLDITGEIAVFEGVLRQGKKAEAAGVVLLPGAGFDVVPSDCLAKRLAEALPDATHLELAFVHAGGSWSRGTLATMIEGLPGAGAERRDGKIVPLPVAAHALTVEFPIGRRTVVSLPWGDVSTAFHSTGIPNIRVYTGMHPKTLARLRRWRPLLKLGGLPPIKRLLQRWVRKHLTGPDAATRAAGRVYLWGRAWNARGEEVSATLTTPEGYSFTAQAAVECARRLLAGEVAPGAWTPSRAFGAGFVATLPGVEVGAVIRETKSGNAT